MFSLNVLFSLLFCLKLCVFIIAPLSVALPAPLKQNGRKDCTCLPIDSCDDYNDDTDKLYRKGNVAPRTSRCQGIAEICCFNVVHQSLKSFTKKPTKCGFQLSKSYGSRILSGKPSTFGELPWNLIVEEVGENYKPNLFLCGASLIHPKVALTAAHCVEAFSVNPNGISVKAGEHNVESNRKAYLAKSRLVEEVILHEEYSPFLTSATIENDIALLFLYKPYTFSDNINAICLPHPDLKIIEKNCIVSGWGKTTPNNDSYSSVLRKVGVPIVDNQRCVESLRSTDLGVDFKLHESFMCAGGQENKDSCKGDGGSPLICPLEGEDRWVQVGIVSWGVDCGLDKIPGVYVNVLYFREWIEEEIKYRSLDTETKASIRSNIKIYS